MTTGSENKLKHLEFIQNVITRMNSNSFSIKGWTVTLVLGAFAFSVGVSQACFLLLTYLPITMFWFLDGFYLNQERCYRALYSEVAAKDEAAIDFSMNASKYAEKSTWSSATFSKTLVPFYLCLAIVNLIVLIVLCYLKLGGSHG